MRNERKRVQLQRQDLTDKEREIAQQDESFKNQEQCLTDAEIENEKLGRKIKEVEKVSKQWKDQAQGFEYLLEKRETQKGEALMRQLLDERQVAHLEAH